VAFSSIQVTGNSTGSGTSVSKAFTSNVAVGNLIVVCGMKFSPGADDPFVAGDCTKSAGTATLGTIALDKTFSHSLGSDRLVSGVWSAVVTGAGTCTMQVGGALASSAINIGIQELHSDTSTTYTVEGTNTGEGASGNASTGTVTSAGAAAFIGASTYSSGVITVTEGTGYSQIFEQQDGSSFVVCNSEYQLVTTGTTDNADWTAGTNTGWAAVLVVYKEGAAAAATGWGAPLIAGKRNHLVRVC